MSIGPRVALVTGATGFVGASIVREMAREGWLVVAYDISPPPLLLTQFWAGAATEVKFEQGSVLDEGQLAAVIARYGPSVLIHAAAVTAVHLKDEIELGDRLVEVNVLGTLRVLTACKGAGVTRLVYISTAGLYGPTSAQAKVTEDQAVEPIGLYLVSKDAGERLCLRYGELHDLSVVIARLTQPYGPMERDTDSRPVLSVIYQAASAAIRTGHAYVSGDDYLCDWTCTLDIARAIRLLSQAPALDHRVFNISCGVATRLTEVLKDLSELLPGSRFDFSEDHAMTPINTEDDPRRGALDIGRLIAAVNFSPVNDMKRGLQASIPWWEKS